MKTIFLVEDNHDLREMLMTLFTSHMFNVLGCPDAKTFHNEMKSGLPDLVVMDVQLPDGNGLDLCRELKSNELSQHIPVVILTAHRTTKEEAELARADEFLRKPFNIVDLMSRIRLQLAN